MRKLTTPPPGAKARVLVGDQVWTLHPGWAERMAAHPTRRGVQLWPIRSDYYDTTAQRPMWPGGIPHPTCPRWATPADLEARPTVGRWRS